MQLVADRPIPPMNDARQTWPQWRATTAVSTAASHQPAGDTSKFVRGRGISVICALLVGTGGAMSVDFVANREDRGYRLQSIAYPTSRRQSAAAELKVRTAAENLALVRDAFKPSVTELASLLGVSRQAIYNWQAGQTIAPENEDRLAQLARAAEYLEGAGISGSSSVLRRKLPGGKTVVESVSAGEDAEAAATALVAMLRKEHAQRDAIGKRLQQRGTGPVSLAEAGTPHFIERV